jgi:lipid-A-disaccharide synthase
MRSAGVRAVVESESLSVVGLVEVLSHVPRIYREFRKLVDAARRDRPDFAILTDSPDFHLRLALKLKRAGVPVFYLIAPQAWAWREGRVQTLRRTVRHLFCIFPFEESFFRDRGVAATYIGHPLAASIRPRESRAEFLQRHSIPAGRPLIAVLPGSRPGEVARHLEPLAGAAKLLRSALTCTLVAGTPPGFAKIVNASSFWERFHGSSIKVVEGSTWDLLAYADVALAASGTVTIEAALLGTPMVTFYRVSPFSWLLGRRLVKVPFLSMVNLVAGRAVVPELIQHDMTAERLAAEVRLLLDNPAARERMRQELNGVRARLAADRDPMESAADLIEGIIRLEISEKERANVR